MANLDKILNYPGAKWRIADWIISHFPEHKTYVEPYAGSAAVFFRKEPSRIETINDMDNDVINLFECIRKDSEKLAFLVTNTPFSRCEYETSRSDLVDDDFEKARKFLIQSWQSFGYRTSEKTGWKNDIVGREKAYAVRHWNQLPEAIFNVVDRLKQAQIECRPAIDVIRKYNKPAVLLYVDPPYLLSTRNRKQYKHEMTEQEHVELLEVLSQHPGSVILSGYDNELYNEKLKGWEKSSIQSNAQGGLHRIETIWIKKEA